MKVGITLTAFAEVEVEDLAEAEEYWPGDILRLAETTDLHVEQIS